jgi:NAD(P)-dependent dehydrogenase (short-subunit alcohol dehydrogenase family)
VDHTVSTLGGIDIIVNNAAAMEILRSGSERPVVEASMQAIEQQFQVNFFAPLQLCRHALPTMIDRGGGSIIAISSGVAALAAPGMTGYGPSKAALESLMRQIAVDYGNHGVRANIVRVGTVRVPDTLWMHDDEDIGPAVRALQMLPRSGTPADVAAAVAYLASDDASFVTGTVLLVDGGVMSKAPGPDVAEIRRRRAASGSS